MLGGTTFDAGEQKSKRGVVINERKKKIRMNPYEQLFEQKSSPGQEAELGKINNFLQLAMKEMNAGRQPNVEKLAKMAGVDVDTAREILAATIDKFNEMKK